MAQPTDTVQQILDDIKPQAEAVLKGASEAWDKFPDQLKDDARKAALELVRLGIEHIRATDKTEIERISREVLILKATIANIGSALLDHERVAIREGIMQVGVIVGQSLAAFARQAVLGGVKLG